MPRQGKKKDGSRFFYSAPKRKGDAQESGRNGTEKESASTEVGASTDASVAACGVDSSLSLRNSSGDTAAGARAAHRAHGRSRQYPIASLSTQAARNGAMPRSTNVRTIEGVDAMPFVQLPPGTNLNVAPRNYLLPDFRYGVHRHADPFERNADVALSALLTSGVRHDFAEGGGAAASASGGGPAGAASAAKSGAKGAASGAGSRGGGGAGSGHSADGGKEGRGVPPAGVPRVITSGDALKLLFDTSVTAATLDDRRRAHRAAWQREQHAALDDDEEVVTPLARNDTAQFDRGQTIEDTAAESAANRSYEEHPPMTLHVHRLGPSLVLNVPGARRASVPAATVAEARQRALLAKALYATGLEAEAAAPLACAATPGSEGFVTTPRRSPLGGSVDFIVPMLTAEAPPSPYRARGQDPQEPPRTQRDGCVGVSAPQSAVAVGSAGHRHDHHHHGQLASAQPRVGSAQMRRNYDPALHAYSHVLQWGIDDLNILLGVDTPILRDTRSGEHVMLAVHDDSADDAAAAGGLTGRAALGTWFDATLANVPHIAVLVHTQGIVRQYDVRSVSSVLDVVEGRRAAAALSYTSHVLQWLLANCTKDGGNYIVIRNAATLELELFDVSDDDRAVRFEALPTDLDSVRAFPTTAAFGEDPLDSPLLPLADPSQQDTRDPPAAAGGSRPPATHLEDRGKAHLHHSVAMLCYKMGTHLVHHLRDAGEDEGTPTTTTATADSTHHRRSSSSGGGSSGRYDRERRSPGSLASAPGTSGQSAEESFESLPSSQGAPANLRQRHQQHEDGHMLPVGANKASDVLSLLQRSLVLFLQEHRVCVARDDATTTLCARVLEPPLHVAELLPSLIARLITTRISELQQEQMREGGSLPQSPAGGAEATDAAQALPGACPELQEYDTTTTVRVPAIYGDAMNIVCDVAHVSQPLLDRVMSAAAHVHAAPNAAAMRQSAAAGARMLLDVARAATVVLSRVVDRHRKVWIDRDIRRRIEADKVKPSAGFLRANKDSFDRLQRELMAALVDVGLTGLQLLQSIVDALVLLLDFEKLIVHGPERARAGAAASTTTTAKGTATDDGNAHHGALTATGGSHRIVEPGDRLVLRADVLAAHAALAEFTGDFFVMAIVDRTLTTQRRIREQARRMLDVCPALAGAPGAAPRPKVRAGIADCNSIAALAQLEADPVASSHQAQRFFRMTKNTCRRMLEKNAEVYLKIGVHYSLTDRYTKALESLRGAKDLLASSTHAPEGARFGAYSQESISGVCGVALEVTVADVHMRKAKAAHHSAMMLHEHKCRMEAAPPPVPPVPPVEASWCVARLVPMAAEEESNWRSAVGIYRRVCDMTAAPPQCPNNDPHTRGDVGHHFAAKFRGLLAESQLHLAVRTIDTLAAAVVAKEEHAKDAREPVGGHVAADLVDGERLRDVRELLRGVYELLPACSAKSLKLAYEELRLFSIALRSAAAVMAQRGELSARDSERVVVWRKLGLRCAGRLGAMLQSVTEGCVAGAQLRCGTPVATDARAAAAAAGNENDDEDTGGLSDPCSGAGSGGESVDGEGLRRAFAAAAAACAPHGARGTSTCSEEEEDDDGDSDSNGSCGAGTMEDALRDYEGDRLSSLGGGSEPFLLPGVKLKVGTYYAERSLHIAFGTPLVQVHHQLALFWYASARVHAARSSDGAPSAGAAVATLRCDVGSCLAHCRHGLATVLVAPQRESPAFRHHAQALELLVRHALMLAIRTGPRGAPCVWSDALARLLRGTAGLAPCSAARISVGMEAAEMPLCALARAS